MKSSIKRFLLFNLLFSILLAASLSAVGNYFLENHDIQQYLDNQLKQTSAILMMTLSNDHNIIINLKKIQKTLAQTETKLTTNYTLKGNARYQFMFWDKKGRLLLRSEHPPEVKNITQLQSGFYTLSSKHHLYRIYIERDPKTGLQIALFEALRHQEALKDKITLDNLLIILWTYPFLALLILLTVTHGFKSLRSIADHLATREPTDFHAIDLERIPIEIVPLIAELNQLFMRLQNEFIRNKRFAADAAHELRTPLAALKTQSQVALLAASEQERKSVLRNVIKGADRCTHIVQQLLTLSRLGQNDTLDKIEPTDLNKIATETIAQLAHLAVEKNIEIEFFKPREPVIILGNATALNILIRNLVDNAIRYTPEQGTITIRISLHQSQTVLSVIDSGPGIPEEFRTRIFERFFRILGTKAPGSGLGLPIVKQVADLHHASIQLGSANKKEKTGLKIDILFPLPPKE